MATYSAPLIYKTIFNTLDYTTAATITNASDTIYTGKNTFTNNLILNGKVNITNQEPANSIGNGALQILGGISIGAASFFGSTVSMLSPPIMNYTTFPSLTVDQLGYIMNPIITAPGSTIATSITGLGTQIVLSTSTSFGIGTWLFDVIAEYTSNSSSNVIGVETVQLSSNTGQSLTQVSFGPNSLTRRIKYTHYLELKTIQNLRPILRLDYATTGGFVLGNCSVRAIRIA